MIDRGNEGDPPTTADEYPGKFGPQGEEIFDALSHHENLFLMLGGHIATEGERDDVGPNGNTIYTLLSDYQNQPNGGNGWLRIMEFSPANNEITVSTFSPTYDNGDGTATLEGYQVLKTTFQVILKATDDDGVVVEKKFDLNPEGQITSSNGSELLDENAEGYDYSKEEKNDADEKSTGAIDHFFILMLMLIAGIRIQRRMR